MLVAPDLPIGTHVGTDTPAVLHARRLNRHTFWCGQSGSGKTYALGVLLEQVLLHTRLPVVVLDPNSDFVHLAEPREDAPIEVSAELSKRHIRVLGDSAEDDSAENDRLRVSFVDLDVRTRAAVLQLDPVLDAEEFNILVRLSQHNLSELDSPLLEWLRKASDPSFERIAVRLENLGILEWDFWAYGKEDVTEVIEKRADATVVDLGHFDTAAQMQTAALAVLDRLWARRHERIGRLVVIDEAHNLCSPDAATPLERLLTERIVQIAAEGRKYGIWLLLSTQRPSKMHANVISQCDNLALMRMSSSDDLADIAKIFGYSPAELVQQATGFRQGQALFAGSFSPDPQLVQMRERVTREGGSDVAVPLR